MNYKFDKYFTFIIIIIVIILISNLTMLILIYDLMDKIYFIFRTIKWKENNDNKKTYIKLFNSY